MVRGLSNDRQARAERQNRLRPRTWRWAFDRLSQKAKDGPLTYDAWATAIKEASGVRVNRAELQKALLTVERGGKLEYEAFETMLKTFLNMPNGQVREEIRWEASQSLPLFADCCSVIAGSGEKGHDDTRALLHAHYMVVNTA